MGRITRLTALPPRWKGRFVVSGLIKDPQLVFCERWMTLSVWGGELGSILLAVMVNLTPPFPSSSSYLTEIGPQLRWPGDLGGVP